MKSEEEEEEEEEDEEQVMTKQIEKIISHPPPATFPPAAHAHRRNLLSLRACRDAGQLPTNGRQRVALRLICLAFGKEGQGRLHVRERAYG